MPAPPPSHTRCVATAAPFHNRAVSHHGCTVCAGNTRTSLLARGRRTSPDTASSPHNKTIKNNDRNTYALLKRLSPAVGGMQQRKRSRGNSPSVNYRPIAYNKNGCRATQKTRYAVPCLGQRQHAGTKGFQS